MKYTLTKYGKTSEFTNGQKVECIYYHEYAEMKDARKRSLLSKLIDRPFKPVKLGVIVGNAGTHPYWLGTNRKEQYLFVKFREYFLPKAIPISCIQDALESAENRKSMIEENRARLGEPGYDQESFDSLNNMMNKAFVFVGKPESVVN